jgi:hypothetical protein
MPEERGYSDDGRVRIAVSRVGCCLSSARRPCRNCRIELGCEEDDGYSAGERRDGITRRWIVFDGEEASCCWRLCNMDTNVDDELRVGRGIGI